MTELEYLIKNKEITQYKSLCYCAYKIKNDIGCGHMDCGDCELCNNDYFVFSILLKEHKEKIKLTQFEYDIIASYYENQNSDQHNQRLLNAYAVIPRLKYKGYFKDLDLNLTIKEVYENCEVISDE